MNLKICTSGIDISTATKKVGGGVGGGGDREGRVWISRFPYLLLPVPAPFRSGFRRGVLFLLRNIAKFISYSSRVPPPWVSRLPPSLLPLPVHFLPPLLPGSHPPVPLHKSWCLRNRGGRDPSWLDQSCLSLWCTTWGSDGSCSNNMAGFPA